MSCSALLLFKPHFNLFLVPVPSDVYQPQNYNTIAYVHI